MAVPYLPTWLLAAVGMLLLVAVSVRVLFALKRFTTTAARARHGFGEETGLLRARSAALKIAMTQQFGARGEDDLRQVGSTEYGQTGGRP